MKKSENHSINWLAGKYLQGRGRSPIGKAHWLTLAGILLGVIALLCVSSVMNGFRADIGKRIVGTLSEIRVVAPEGKSISDEYKMVKDLEVMGFTASPVIRNELLIKKGTVAIPTISFGIDAARHRKVTKVLDPQRMDDPDIRQGMIAGRIEADSLRDDEIVLAAGLASQLQAYINDSVQVISPRFSIPTAFGMIPRVRTFNVVGVFESAMPDYQQSYSFMGLDNARFFNNTASGVDYLDVKTRDFTKVDAAASRIAKRFPGFKVEPWSRFDASLYSAIRFEKVIMFVIMLFMYVIASFNLTGNMLKTIAQKKRELGLLKAIGYRDNDLRKLFLRQSLMLSSVGISIGLLIASLLLFVQGNYNLVKLGTGGGAYTNLPVNVMWQDFLWVVLVSYLITVISVLLPLRRLKGIDAVELIRKAV
jgi:lipoprotein-releasing system permease protein